MNDGAYTNIYPKQGATIRENVIAPPLTLEEINKRIQGLLGTTSELNDRVRNLGYRLYGGDESLGQSSAVNPTRPGVIGAINDSLDQLEECVAGLLSAVIRIDNVA